MNTEFEKEAKEFLYPDHKWDDPDYDSARRLLVKDIVKLHNQHLRTVLEGLKHKPLDSWGNLPLAEIDAEIAKLGGGDE